MSGESRSVVVRLSLDTAQAIQSSKQFGDEFGRALDHAEKRTQSTRAAVDQLTSTTGKVALAAGAALGAIVMKTANFDEAMSHVAATGDDARSSIDALREAAIQAGQDTAFSATEAAGGVENLAKAGLSAKDILGGGLKGSLDLAAAGGLEVADSAEIAATALTQFKLQGADVPHVADLLAAAAGKAQGDVSDMSMALKQSGLVASQMNLSIEETTGTLAAFASAGLLGSDAGTSFRTMLLRLANPTTESADLMKQLGIQAYDAQGKFVGMASLAGQLQSALSDQTQAQRDAALATLFGSDAIRAASVLYAQGADGITDWTSKVDDSGYAAKTAATRMDNLKGDIEQFTGSLETALIGAGEGSQGPLRKLVQGATDVVNVFNKAPGPVQSTTTALLGVVAVTSGAAWFGSKVIRGVQDTRAALDQLGWSGSRASRGLRGVAAAGAGLAAVVATADLLQRAMDKIADTRIDSSNLNRDLEALADGRLTDNLDNIASAFEDIGDKWQRDANPLSWISSWDPSGFEAASDTINQLDDALASMVESGNADMAAEAFDRILEEAAKVGVSADDAAGYFDEYNTALSNAGLTSHGWAGIISDLGQGVLDTSRAFGNGEKATGDFGVSMRKAAANAKQLRDDLAASREEARTTARGFITLGDSLDNGKKSLGEWLHELEKQAQALRDFTSNAQTAAHRGLDKGLIASLEEAGSAGALRMKQLANATDSEIDRANRAWRKGQDAIRDYVAMKVPPKNVVIDNHQALGAIATVQARLASLHSKTIAIDIATGQRRAAGGPIVGPGSKTSDSVPVMASSGEFMMSAAAVDHYGLDTMFAMNARRLAAGGSVDGKAWHGAGGTPYMPDVLDLSWLVGIDRLGERELHRRESIAEREERLAEKSLKQAQDRLEEERAALKDLRDARREFMSQVTDNFRTDLFGGSIDLAELTRNGHALPDLIAGLSAYVDQLQTQDDFKMSPGGILDYLDQYLASLTQQQLAQFQAQASISVLGQNTTDADAFEKVLEQLRAMGLHGGAYSQLAASGNLAQAQAYLQMGPGFIQSLMQDFRRREHALQSLGQSVGNARFGADIREQLKEVRHARRIAAESRDELREIKQGQARLEKRVQRVEKAAAETGPDRTAAGVGKVINHGSAAANRRPPR